MMVRTGAVGAHDNETSEVRVVTLDEAQKLFSSVGNSRDARIVALAREYLDKMNDKTPTNECVKKPLNELHVNLLGKIFFATLGAWLVGKVTNTKIRGTQQEVQAISNALLASRRFQEELRKPGASVESVIDKLGMKHMSAREFESVLGVPWPL